MRLLFVTVAGQDEDRVAKQRQYAACKAHTTRNAHRKRRQEQRKAESSPCRHANEGTQPKLVLQPTLDSVLGRIDRQSVEQAPLFDQAVSFVRFYHNASWSPMRMACLQDKDPQQSRLRGLSAPNQANARDWLWNIFVTNTGTFWSVIASILPILRLVVTLKDASKLEKVGLELKAKSYLHLRQTLQHAPLNFQPSMGLIYHVKALFREAAMNGDLQGAEVHAKMLMWLVEKLPGKAVSATQILRIALWSDAIPALLQLRRPVIEYRHWMPRLVDSIWGPVELMPPDSQHPVDDLPGFIHSPPLRAAIEHAHRALKIRQACKDCRLEYTEQIFQWMTTKAEYHICNMLSLYFDLNELDGDIDLTKGARHTEAAVALALLHLYQKSFSDISGADGVDMHETAGVIRTPLMTELRDAFAWCSPSEGQLYRGTHSWLAFVGASLGK